MGQTNCDSCGNDKKMCSCGKHTNTEFLNDRSSVNLVQIDGDHYRSGYQHWDWSVDVSLGIFEYAASKYISRWKKKNGKVDLQKSIHYIEKAIEVYKNKSYLSAYDRQNCFQKYPYDYEKIVQYCVQFFEENDIGAVECICLMILANWKTVDELNFVINQIQWLINNHSDDG